MLSSIHHLEANKDSEASARPGQVSIHGHFYQPPRESPFSGQVPHETGAEPYANFNEKINAECYRPNALQGNFERISFNFGPTLAAWVEQHDPETYARILAGDKAVYQRCGYGNALAQNYNHLILPLATPQEARLQIEWGIMDFERRFGHQPEGMWLAETAASAWVLDIMAQVGLKFVILAPWQADVATVETLDFAERATIQSRLRQQAIDRWRAQFAGLPDSLPLLPNRVPEPFDVSEPYQVELEQGRSLVVFFYNGKLSGDISFNQAATADAGRYVNNWLLPELNRVKLERGETQLLMVATDGELYGHHQPYRELFLRHLTTTALQQAGLELTLPARYWREHPPRRRLRIVDDTSWSCHHGVARWRAGCFCTTGNTDWKRVLRRACDNLAAELDRLYEALAARLLKNGYSALREYLWVWQGHENAGTFLQRHLRPELRGKPAAAGMAARLLKAQMYKHQMYTSCAWFFEDIDRLEPRNALAAAAIIFRLLRRLLPPELESGFSAGLSEAISQYSGLNGALLYQQVVRQGETYRLLNRPPALPISSQVPQPAIV